MTLIDATVDRLGTAVAALAGGRVKGALELAEMLRQKALPNYTPAAFVVDNGLNGGAAESSQGAVLQAVDETLSIVLVLRTAGDVTGAKTQPQLNDLKWAVVFALVGWSPADAIGDDETGTIPIGVFELRRGRVISLDAGTVFYQLDFAISQQVRVIS